MSEALRVVVTGAAGQIGYSLLLPIASGSVFGADQKIDLVLLDIAPMMVTLEGVRMELDDCALPLLNKIVCSSDAATAFENADVAILVGAMPRKEGMERKDLLKANVRIFKAQGEAINNHAKKSIKILVVGNPANTNALICSKYAPDIPKSAFSCLTRLDQNRAQAQIAIRAGVGPDCVYNCVIWGNHSSTQYPDVRNAKIKKDDKTLPASEVISDEAWIKGDFVTTVQKRGAAVIAARKLSSAMSAAKAICDHMRDWWNGTPEGKWASMGVFSDGSYKIPEGLMYSFPVTIKNKECTIVKGLSIDDFSQSKMDLTQKELEDERDVALAACESD